jgi:hypothetical protein
MAQAKMALGQLSQFPSISGFQSGQKAVLLSSVSLRRLFDHVYLLVTITKHAYKMALASKI